MDFYQTSTFRKFQRKFTNELNKHQNDALDFMDDNDRGTICMPTGTGKSRIIYGDMLDKIQFPTYDVFAIASHRLLLNSQHLSEITCIFNELFPRIGIVFIGSMKIDPVQLFGSEINARLASENITTTELIACVSSNKEVVDLINFHKSNNRDTIIITTYHSMDKIRNINIHTLYCDEAHTLVTTQEQAQFKQNYEKVTASRNFFFTATPKDIKDKEDVGELFVMDNKEIFGERLELTFTEALERSLIVKPKMHIVEIDKYCNKRNYISPKNYAKVILETFVAHKNTLKNVELCAPKLLIKCDCVDSIWKIRTELLKQEESKNIKIFACASRGGDDDETNSFYMNKTTFKNKTSFLKAMQSLNDNEHAIILHFDILSEGIDVPGITGVMFLSDTLPTTSKICQTIGRSTRLHKIDRKNIFTERTVLVGDTSKMIKPDCAVILPVLNDEMYKSSQQIAMLLRNLRDKYNMPIEYCVLGNDNGKQTFINNIEGINKPDFPQKRFTMIDKINHIIEDLDVNHEKYEAESQFKEFVNNNDIDSIVEYLKTK